MLLSFLYYERLVMLLFRRIPRTVDFILKEDKTPTSIGGELQQLFCAKHLADQWHRNSN